MLRRIPALAALSLLLALSAGPPRAHADTAPAKPNAPKQIDQTPPLVPIPNARVAEDGLLVGGQPSPEQLKAIHQAGYKTVINLRTEGERGDEGEREAVQRMGMKFVSLPVAGGAGLTEENARSLGHSLAAQDALPAVVHCRVGERASALLGLRAFVVARQSPQAAMDLARSLGMKKLEPSLRARIEAICKADRSRNCGEVK